MPNITPEAFSSPNKPERPKGQYISEVEMDHLKQVWMKSIAMIMTKKDIKINKYEVTDVNNRAAINIIDSANSDEEHERQLLQENIELRDIYNKSPHKQNVIPSINMYFDDGDKIICIQLFNEEASAKRDSEMEHDLLEISFDYKNPVDIVDRHNKIRQAVLTTAKQEKISIVMQDKHRNTSSKNAMEITETLLRLANDPFLAEKSLTESEYIKLIDNEEE